LTTVDGKRSVVRCGHLADDGIGLALVMRVDVAKRLCDDFAESDLAKLLDQPTIAADAIREILRTRQ
jgi:hypothetical protein